MVSGIARESRRLWEENSLSYLESLQHEILASSLPQPYADLIERLL